jgi:hypothetical protein
VPDKNVRDELAEAVRELKDREVADTIRELRGEIEKLRAERASHHCHGCHCTHVHWYPYTQTYPAYPAVTTPVYTVSTTGSCISGVTTNAAAGGVSTFGITN